MNCDKETEEIFCHLCGEWLKVRQGTYLEGEVIKCLECDAVLGYTWDWPELFGAHTHTEQFHTKFDIKENGNEI